MFSAFVEDTAEDVAEVVDVGTNWSDSRGMYAQVCCRKAVAVLSDPSIQPKKSNGGETAVGFLCGS